MNDPFAKAKARAPYIQTPDTEQTESTSSINVLTKDPSAEFKADLSKAANAYQKVTSTVVIKRYAVRRD